MRTSIKSFISLTVLTVFIISCKKKENISPSDSYTPTVIPEAATSLIKKISGTDIMSDTVFLVVQGGPMPALVETQEAIEVVGDPSLPMRYEMYLVHQAQTYNSEKVLNKGLTFEQIKLEAQQSSGMLQKVVEYFKGRDKFVLIWGYSYGFFVIEDLLARHEIKFDRAFLGGGRLDMTEAVWKNFSEGMPVIFNDDAVTVSDADAMRETGDLAKFAAGLGHNRYTQLLADVELDPKKILFYFGGLDTDVGKPTDAELKFLDDKKALYIYDKNIGHNINEENGAKIIDFLLNGTKP